MENYNTSNIYVTLTSIALGIMAYKSGPALCKLLNQKGTDIVQNWREMQPVEKIATLSLTFILLFPHLTVSPIISKLFDRSIEKIKER